MDARIVGVTITAEVAVPGCATGASHPLDMEMAVRFFVEVAKVHGEGRCAFYDEPEFKRLIQLYGPLEHLKTPGKAPHSSPIWTRRTRKVGGVNGS